MRISRLSIFVAVGLAAVSWTGGIAGADTLAPYATKKDLTQKDKADIQVTVIRRVARLSEAKDQPQYAAARAELVDTAKIAGATNVFLDEYAVQCADALAGAMSDPKVATALNAVLVLSELDRPRAVGGFISALKNSPHPFVRIKAAKGIQKLHKRLKRPQDLKAVISALGTAGAAETNTQLVLPEIYRALDFGDVQDFKHGNDCAEALAKIFEARKSASRSSAQSETADLPGYKAVLNCSNAAAGAQRKRMARAVLDLMSQTVDRGYDPQTSNGTKSTLNGVLREAHKALVKVLSDSNVATGPSDVPDLRSQPQDKTRDWLKALEASVQKIA